jgi:hypothetical protein
LTLVIQKEADIPRVRSKVKLLVRAIGAPVLQMTRLAVGASETARLLLQMYGGGKVRISLFPYEALEVECGLELLFHGNAFCLKGDVCPLDNEALLALSPFPGLKKVFDSVLVMGGIRGRKITIRCRSTNLGLTWKKVHGRLSVIRKELFADTEESYMENLRAKHDEVLRLLRDKTEKNRLLDQSNTELLKLSNDLEEMARERTIIEMSLRIADQVRNPATVIGGMARRLLEKGDFADRELKKIKMIVTEADKIEELVKQFNRMAADRRTLFGRENLVLLMEEALKACPTLRRKNLRARVDAPSQLVEIHANPQVLKIALVHILRYLTEQSAEGEELSIVIVKGGEPQVTITGKTDAGAQDISAAAGGPSGKVVPGSQTGLELVRQILNEHQAGFSSEIDGTGRITVSIRFPRVFHEQGDPLGLMGNRGAAYDR